MSHNNWETQPRKKNGQFSNRYESNFMKNIFKSVRKDLTDKDIKKISRGGSYGFLRKFTSGNNLLEIHHMPANVSSTLSRWKGPCIIMSKEDHTKTSSYKNTKAAVKYRKWQAKLISEGKFLEAEFMDIKNIRRKFGNKYDKSIDEKIDYEKSLISEGIING